MSKQFSAPGIKQLENAYSLLLVRRQKIPQSTDIIQYAHWSRFDPRLGEVLTGYLLKNWHRYNAINLYNKNIKSIWPQCLAVILEHLLGAYTSGYQNKCLPKAADEKKAYEHFYSTVVLSIKSAPYQSYTIGVYRMAGGEQMKRAENPHPYFKKWGFYERDTFYSKSFKLKMVTAIKKEDRIFILKKILKQNKEISISDYIKACHNSLHRRQAERDLSEIKNIKSHGFTRAKRYYL